VTPELSRRIGLGQIGEAGRRETLVASPAECAALALRFGIPAVHALSAELRLTRAPGGAVAAEGALSAEVTQDCVVTLEPVRQGVRAPLQLRFLPEGAAFSDDPDGPDEIEFAGDFLELGEAVAEQLALALDPYPRAPEAPGPDAAPEEPPAAAPRPSPFAALAGLKRKLG
jgi:uncharacterized metal-binding protein YceD (DUF177 family)